MSGLLALLDDVAVIARMAAASADDIVGQAGRAGTKLAGVVIDDAAVTPRYVHGLSPAREIPMIWRITRGSLFNKLVLLLPAALGLAAFAPWAIAPLLMLGGLYLVYEGAEKVWGALTGHGHHKDAEAPDPANPHLEEERVRGAVKTDFILSAEIMAITLASLPGDRPLLWQAVVLALVAVVVTVLVYGVVALIVKADDLGLWLARAGRTAAGRGLGRLIVRVMPGLLTTLSVVGTVAMLWVGGSIVVHALHEMGWHLPHEVIEGIARAASGLAPGGQGAVAWIARAFADGVLGLALGLLLIPVASRLVNPLIAGAKRLAGRAG